MDNSILILKYIRSILIENEDVMNLVSGDNIFSLIAHKEAQLPYIVMSRNSIQTQYTKDRAFDNTVQFTVNVVADSYIDSIELANAVRHAIENFYWKNTDIYIHPISVVSISEATDGDQFVQSLVFSTMVE